MAHEREHRSICKVKALLRFSYLAETKMNFKLRASISPLFSSRKRSISEAVSIERKLHFSNGDVSSNKCHARFKYFVNSSSEKRISHSRLMDKFWIPMTTGELSMSFSRYGVQGIQNLKRSIHSSSNEEDDFSELGLPVSEGAVAHPKVVTEQPNGSVKQSDPSGRDAFGRPLHGTNVPRMKNLPQRQGPNGFNNRHAEFKAINSNERGVETRGISPRSVHLPIRSPHVQENITIRIKNVSVDTAEPAIHSICMSCGPVEGLSRTKDGTVDVFFNVNDASVRQGMLKKLNEVFMDNCQWSAQVLPRVTTKTDMSRTADTQLRAGLQFKDLLVNISKQFRVKNICLEDLMELHTSVVHLQDHPKC